MKKLAIVGAGGFANEIKAHMKEFNLKCFVDEKYYIPNNNNISPLSEFDPDEYKVIIGIGDSKARYEVVTRLPKETEYFTFIHSSAQIIGNDVEIGEGSIICAGVIITTNCIIGKHAHLNLLTTVGHDCRIGDFFTTTPGVKISGNCSIGDRVYFGTNATIKQKINVCDDVTIGSNAAVVSSVQNPGIYVGIPAKKLER